MPPLSDEARALQDALGDRYEIGAELGRGGMATVYRARDIKHQRDVAVKVIDPGIASGIGLQRFQREIAFVATLQHPGIVPLYDSGGAGERLYYIMPVIEGESLRDRLKREGQLPVEDALSVLRDVADALAYAHAHGVIHRDIKPANILLSGGRAVVADFGIARALTQPAGGSGERLTETSLAVGTPAYMSPEQVAGSEVVDGRADIYSLGCVLYEMLAGEPPFTGRTPQAVIARHMQERPPSLQVVRSSVPLALQDVVERALAKAPADRFASAVQFAEAAAAATPQRTGSATVRVSGRAMQQRRPRAILWGGAGLVFAAAAWWGLTRPPELNANRVVVFPFAVPGAADDAGIGEQVALLVGSALEHTAPLAWFDGAGLLSGDDVRSGRIAVSAAGRAARRVGAQHFVTGAVVATGDSLVVIVRLHDARGDSVVRQETSRGLASLGSPQLALRAIARTLPVLLPPGGQVDLSYVEDRNPAAVADWLQGEREYARGQYARALTHLRRALETDSTIGVAALRGVLAAVYLEDPVTAGELAARAHALEHQSPLKHQLLGRGLRHFLAGAADSALIALREASRADPAWSEPHALTGLTYASLMLAAPNPDSLAEAAFRRAVEFQPGYAPALYHLAQLALLRGDVRGARRFRERFDRAQPEAGWAFQLELLVRCATDGARSIDWPSAVARASGRIVNVARVLGAGGRYPECSRMAQEAVLAHDADPSTEHFVYRWSALKGLDFQAIAELRFPDAIALVDSARGNGMRQAVSLHILNAAAGAEVARPKADSAMATLARPIGTMGGVALRYFALWEYHRRDVVRLDSVVTRVRFVADSARSPADALVAECAAARLALLTGDTTEALRLLRNLRIAIPFGAVAWNLWEAAAAERLVLAELLLATGDPRGAIEVAEVFDSPRSQIHLLYLRPSLEIRLRAAGALGDGAARTRYAGRLDRLSQPDRR